MTAGNDALVLAARANRVSNPRVLQAMSETPRSLFVPAQMQERASRDVPIPIPCGQVTTQPSLCARMLAALGLEGHERVLEVGAGLGYQSALLARLAREVWSVERFGELAAAARDNLARAGIDTVNVVVGDGTRGWPAAAPFDAVVVSAAFENVPPPLVEQLRLGGRLVQPIRRGAIDEVVTFFVTEVGLRREGDVLPARFVPLVGEYGYRG